MQNNTWVVRATYGCSEIYTFEDILCTSPFWNKKKKGFLPWNNSQRIVPSIVAFSSFKGLFFSLLQNLYRQQHQQEALLSILFLRAI
jgi:hypothetical protein